MRLLKLKSMKRINGLHFTPDGGRLLVVGGAELGPADDAAWIDLTEGAETRRIELLACCYAASADLTRAALGNPSELGEELPPLVVFDPSSPSSRRWRVVLPVGRTATEVYGLAFDPTGKRLAVSYCIADRTGYHTKFRLAVFPLGRGKPVEVIDRDSDEFTASLFAFSPDGKLLACDGGVEGRPTVKVLNAKTLSLIRTIFPKGSQTRQLLYSPDGGTLAIAHAKAVLCVPADSDALRVSLAHPKQVNAVAFTPDGQRLLSTCTDQLLRIWDIESGQLVTSFNWNIGQITAVAVSPDGLTAAVGGQKGQVVVVDLDG